jgi:hypothetical protein
MFSALENKRMIAGVRAAVRDTAEEAIIMDVF